MLRLMSLLLALAFVAIDPGRSAIADVIVNEIFYNAPDDLDERFPAVGRQEISSPGVTEGGRVVRVSGRVASGEPCRGALDRQTGRVVVDASDDAARRGSRAGDAHIQCGIGREPGQVQRSCPNAQHRSDTAAGQ